MKKEPVAVWSALAALIVLGLGYFNVTWVTGEMVETLLQALAVIVTAFVARQKVMPVATINEAGLTTDDVKHRAESRTISPVREP